MKRTDSPTSVILNRPIWVDKHGQMLDPNTDMGESHIRNTIHFLYTRRAYLLHHSSPETIEKYDDPDYFFREVIRKSVLWNTLVDALKQPQSVEFLIFKGVM